ncbi:amidohydrolase family protein [Brevibacterium album]|uniref:amidohydrolase family protein n=1 Tax=Brevibacterium album TaxID=417948 RepID=UPI00041E9CE1|nr:amidohydrolase family protein [Brevibacterium album]
MPIPAGRSVDLESKGRLVVMNCTVVDGTGAPAYGPAHIVVEDSKIVEIIRPYVPGAREGIPFEGFAPGSDDRVVDAEGGYVLPGFIDAHAHIGGEKQTPDAQLVYDLWIAHGITTVREAGSLRNGLDFVVSEAGRSSRNEIIAPSIEPYVVFAQGAAEELTSPASIDAWLEDVKGRGAAGVKFFGARPDVYRHALQRAREMGLLTMCHRAQTDVLRTNVRHSARWGLTSVEHAYGIPEAMFIDKKIQEYPLDYNYVDEQDRFRALGSLWRQAPEPGHPAWSAFIDELVDSGITLVPTFVAYVASRDLTHAKGRPWHTDFTTGVLSRFFTPNRASHGAYFFDWTTEDEVAWRDNYQRWMAFVREFYLRGGKVAIGSDAGFIYNVFGFGFVEELELFREAGFSPLEIVSIATLRNAELLQKESEIGSVEVGKDADLLIIRDNPLRNLKLLYGTGHAVYSDEGEKRCVGGVETVVKKGAVIDARETLERARRAVAAERADTQSEMY